MSAMRWGVMAGIAFVGGVMLGTAVAGDGLVSDPPVCGVEIFGGHSVSWHGPMDDEGASERLGDLKRNGWSNVTSTWSYGHTGTIEADCLVVNQTEGGGK